MECLDSVFASGLSNASHPPGIRLCLRLKSVLSKAADCSRGECRHKVGRTALGTSRKWPKRPEFQGKIAGLDRVNEAVGDGPLLLVETSFQSLWTPPFDGLSSC